MEEVELLLVMALCDIPSSWSCLPSCSFSPKVFKSQIYSISVRIAFNWLPSILFCKSSGNTVPHYFPIYPECVCAKSFQSCLNLCNPMDCSPPGSSVHGILQTRILEWVAMPSSRDLPNPRIEPKSLKSPYWQVDSFLLVPPGNKLYSKRNMWYFLEYCALLLSLGKFLPKDQERLSFS